MSFPTARIGDFHICPMAPPPHIGGPIIKGQPDVLVGGMPAARATDQATCSGPPDFIVVGSATVLIGGLMAARQTSQTMHGGMVQIGCPTVLVGGASKGATLGNPSGALADFNAAASGRTSGDSQQTYGNCGVESVRNILQGMGTTVSENTLLNQSIANGDANDDPNPTQRGGTNAWGRDNILEDNGVASDLVPPTHGDIQQAVAEKKGVITAHDAGGLWNDPNYAGGGHAVQVTGIEYDASGEPMYVIINDTGAGTGFDKIPASQFYDSLRPSPYPVNVTQAPIP